MSVPARTRGTAEQDEAAIAALAKRTRTAPDVVRSLYAEEVSELRSTATVKNFIGVIAGRRVRRRLMAAPQSPR